MATTAPFESLLRPRGYFQFPFRVKTQVCYHNRSNYPNANVGIKTTNPNSSLVVSITGNALITAENTGDYPTVSESYIT